MAIKMKALRTFAGAEGFLRRGMTFEVLSQKRATELSDAELAIVIESDEVNHTEVPRTEPPPQGDSWGLSATGGGWYELPNGERVQGFEAAQEALYHLLDEQFGKQMNSNMTDEEVRLIEPVEGPEIVDPKQPEMKAKAEPSSFENFASHVGGGWYELPSGERVQGKENAYARYEAEKRGEA